MKDQLYISNLILQKFVKFRNNFKHFLTNRLIQKEIVH